MSIVRTLALQNQPVQPEFKTTRTVFAPSNKVVIYVFHPSDVYRMNSHVVHSYCFDVCSVISTDPNNPRSS